MRYTTPILPVAILLGVAIAAPAGFKPETDVTTGQTTGFDHGPTSKIDKLATSYDDSNGSPAFFGKGVEVSAAVLEKRTFNLNLKYDTGTVYRATYNGLHVLLHTFFDLAINRAIFYWTLDGNNPGPGNMNVGFKDVTRGITQNAYPVAAGQRVVLSGFQGGDTVNIFKAAGAAGVGDLAIEV